MVGFYIASFIFFILISALILAIKNECIFSIIISCSMCAFHLTFMFDYIIRYILEKLN